MRGVFKTTDGGKTWTGVGTPHGDNHDFWINPTNNQILINGNDGGANVSIDGGRTWSTQNNQPTAELYRLETDTRWPYWIYASQQDNSNIAVPSQGNADSFSVAGGESGYIAVDRATRIIYAGNYGGRSSAPIATVEAKRPGYADETGQRRRHEYASRNAPIRPRRTTRRRLRRRSSSRAPTAGRRGRDQPGPDAQRQVEAGLSRRRAADDTGVEVTTTRSSRSRNHRSRQVFSGRDRRRIPESVGTTGRPEQDHARACPSGARSTSSSSRKRTPPAPS
jgi:hypothetical protein